jgi:hypothetical protein
MWAEMVRLTFDATTASGGPLLATSFATSRLTAAALTVIEVVNSDH